MQHLLLTASLMLTCEMLTVQSARGLQGLARASAGIKHVELRLDVVSVIIPDPGTVACLLLYGSATLGGQHAS